MMRDRRIVAALDQVSVAKEALKAVVAEVQEACSHTAVVEAPYYQGTYLSSLPAQRTCVCCGLTEYSAWGSNFSGRWSTVTEGPVSMQTDYSRKAVLTTEFYKRVSRDEIRKYEVR